MAYQPLTKEQFQKARAAGFTPEKITAMEQKRKASDVTQAPAPQAKVTTEADRGFLGNMAVGIATPFLRTAATGIEAAKTGGNIVKSLFQKATGQDEAALKTLQEGKASSEKFAKEGANLGYFGNIKPNETLKEGVASGLQMASNLPIAKGGALTYDILKGAIKEGGKEAFKAGVKTLAKEGAVAGGLNAFGSSLMEGKSAGDTAISTIGGTVGGAIAGPVLGAASAGVGGTLGKYTNIGKLFKGEESKISMDAAKKKVADIADYVRSPLDKTEKAGLGAAKAESEYSGLFGLGVKKYALQDRDLIRAQAVKDLVKPGFNKADENIAKVLQNVDEVYNNDLVPFLKENPAPYQPKELEVYLNDKMKPTLGLKVNPESFRAFNMIKQTGLDIIKKYPPTQEGIQSARIEIDNMINREFGDILENPMNPSFSAIKKSAIKLRTVLNDFTHDSIKYQNMTHFNQAEDFLKEAQKRGMKFESVEDIRNELVKFFGSEVIPENELKALLFRNKLKNINLKLEAVDNMWENASKEIGKNRFQNYFKDPLISKAVGWGGAAAGGAALGGLLFKGSGNNTN